jgi:hypothetical protein
VSGTTGNPAASRVGFPCDYPALENRSPRRTIKTEYSEKPAHKAGSLFLRRGMGDDMFSDLYIERDQAAAGCRKKVKVLSLACRPSKTWSGGRSLYSTGR